MNKIGAVQFVNGRRMVKKMCVFVAAGALRFPTQLQLYEYLYVWIAAAENFIKICMADMSRQSRVSVRYDFGPDECVAAAVWMSFQAED